MGSASLVVLIALTRWPTDRFSGNFVEGRTAGAQPSSDTYQELIWRWDMFRVPTDQSLMLTAFTGAGAKC